MWDGAKKYIESQKKERRDTNATNKNFPDWERDFECLYRKIEVFDWAHQWIEMNKENATHTAQW